MSRFSDLAIVAILTSAITYGSLYYSHLLPRNGLTQTELFNLRSKCSELADKFDDEVAQGNLVPFHFPYYNEMTNQCFVNRTITFDGSYDHGGNTLHFLNDVQTGGVLARSQANAHGKWGWITNPKTGQQEETSYESAENFIHDHTTDKDKAEWHTQ